MRSIKNSSSTSQLLRFGCQNVRSLLDYTKPKYPSEAPPRRTAVCNLEFRRTGAAIVALSESRLADQGSIVESDYTFFWSGKPEGTPRHGGVGFAVLSRYVKFMLQPPQCISSRVMTIRIKLKRYSRTVTFVSVYAPTFKATSCEKDAFYSDLQRTIDMVPSSDLLVLLGDFNARVGCDWMIWEGVVGREGIDETNTNGYMLLEFCARNSLCVTNTFFCHKTWHKGTWMHPRSKTLHMIDFVITRQKDRYLMQDTRVYHSVDVWSDHFFVGSSMVMPVSKPHHRVRLNSSINRRFDVSRLSQPEVVMQYQQALTDALHQLPSRATSNETSETLWSSFSKAVINAATNHLGFTSKRPTPDWFYDNLDTIQPMLLRKKQLLGQVLSARKANISVPADLLTQYRSARNHVKYHVHKIQNGWWKHKAEELNHFHIKGDWKNLFSSWKLLSFHRQVHIRSVLDKSGSNVISDPTQIRDRWRSHFNHVLNTTASSYDDSVFNIIPQQPIMEELARPPTVEEVRCALSQVKCNRAAGKDGIPAELLIYGGEQALTFLHTICTEVWSSELIPKEWVDSIIVPLPKKGNLQLCDNWRGISLLSVAGKVFARVLANRITPVAESILDETQCGFRKCRGTIDMIFVARQLQEKAREQMCQLYMCFFDLKKAYDSVPRHALWLLLARLGFPSKLVHILRGLHINMEASVRVDGVLSDPFQVTTGLKQGCVLAPFLFNLYFNTVMHQVLSEFNDGVEIKYRLDGKLFRRSGTKLPMSVRICDLRFADDVMTGCLDSAALQRFIDRFTHVARSWGLSVSTDKTKVITQSATSSSPFNIRGTTIETVTAFQYLGSVLSSDVSLDNEINSRLSKAAKLFSALKGGVPPSRTLPGTFSTFSISTMAGPVHLSVLRPCGTCRLATSRYLPSLAEATMYALDAPLLGDGHLDGWTFGSGDGVEGLTSGVATKWVDLSTQNRAMQEELYPKAVLRRPCGSFTKTTDVRQDLTWNNAKPSMKALTGKVERAIG
ncbi:hypothetical protein EMCRGX_G031880 [Ephydatia muelleri]